MIKTDGKEAWWGSNPVPSPSGDSSLILGELSYYYPSSLSSAMVRSGRVY